MTTVFQAIESLRQYLQRDSEQSSRYAGRFIIVNSSDDWRALLPILMDSFARPLYLSHLCTEDDTLPRAERLLKDIVADRNNVVIVGLGEMMRLYPSQRIEEVVTNLLLLENTSVRGMRRRVYVPLLGAKSALVQIAGNLFRAKESGESASVIELCSDRTKVISLEIADSKLSIPASKATCNGLKRWLEVVEGAMIPSAARLNTSTVTFIRPCSDSVMKVSIIKSHYQKLRTVLDDGEVLPEEFGEPADWALLLDIANSVQERTLEACVQASIAGLSHDVFAALEQWSQLNSSQRWMLWLLMQQRSRRGLLHGYVDKVIRRCDHQNSLTLAVSGAIFDCALSDLKDRPAIHIDRRLLMSKLGINNQPQEFWDELAAIAPEEQLSYLSFFTEDEKCHAINLVCSQQMTLEDIYARKDIAQLYPALHAYVSPFDSGDSWLRGYFNLVRLAKLRNEYMSGIADLLNQWPDRLFSYNARNDVLGKAVSEEVTQVHYYDCLGAEWIPLLCCMISRLAPDLELGSKVARANLPTTTEANRPENAGYLCFDDKRFDGLAHTNVEYPRYLVKQLDIMQQYSQYIVTQAIQHSLLVVTADHGSSRLAILNHHNTIALPEGSKPQYLGRYAISGQPQVGPGWLTTGSTLLMTNHSRFSASGSYGCENHGGATPEEVLVPVMCIRRKRLRIVSIPNTVRYRPKQAILWTVELDRAVNSASASSSVGVYMGELKNGGRTIVFDLTGIRPGRHEVTLDLVLDHGDVIRQTVRLRVSGGLDTTDQFGL